MLKNPIFGCGYGNSAGDGDLQALGLSTDSGDGKECRGGDDDGYGYGFFYGEGDGTVYGRINGDGQGYSRYQNIFITVLIIDQDPVTSAYQLHTLQTPGDHHG